MVLHVAQLLSSALLYNSCCDMQKALHAMLSYIQAALCFDSPVMLCYTSQICHAVL